MWVGVGILHFAYSPTLPHNILYLLTFRRCIASDVTKGQRDFIINHPLYPMFPDLLHALFEGTPENRFEHMRQQVRPGDSIKALMHIEGSTPLMIALNIQPNIPVAEALLAAGADINARTYKGEHALHYCIYSEEAVAWLLDHGVDPNVPIQEGTQSPLGHREQAHTVGWTALHSAAQHDNLAIVELLLKYGANPNSVDYRGETPLHSAAQCNNLPAVELLLKHGANPNSADRYGVTPLLIACRRGYPYKRLIRTLIDAGADIHATGRDGRTPLHLIAWHGGRYSKAVLRMLLYRGANPMIKDASGRLPIDLTSNSARGQSLRAILQKNMTHRVRIWYMPVQKP